jgi:hypothetical protein
VSPVEIAMAQVIGLIAFVVILAYAIFGRNR